MAKVITFSRTFPAYHPKAGKPTYFVEKYLNSIGKDYTSQNYFQELLVLNTVNIGKGKLNFEDIESFWLSLNVGIFDEKPHTIRNGGRWKKGENHSPRVWFGVPYNSPQIIFCQERANENVFSFLINSNGTLILNGKLMSGETESNFEVIAKNDGLDRHDLMAWFKYPKPFKGQIICWNKEVNY